MKCTYFCNNFIYELHYQAEPEITVWENALVEKNHEKKIRQDRISLKGYMEKMAP